MVVVWSGKGWLVPFLALACFVPVFILLSQTATDEHGRNIYFQTNWWWLTGLSFITAGAVNWFYGRHLNNRPGFVAIDRTTGIERMFYPNHSLYWIKMEYWGAVFAATGLGFLVAKLFA